MAAVLKSIIIPGQLFLTLVVKSVLYYFSSLSFPLWSVEEFWRCVHLQDFHEIAMFSHTPFLLGFVHFLLQIKIFHVNMDTSQGPLFISYSH